jgi:hypothetical protein
MAAQANHEPGPGRATSDAAFDLKTKAIAARNEAAHVLARDLRAIREREKARERRERDLR